ATTPSRPRPRIAVRRTSESGLAFSPSHASNGFGFASWIGGAFLLRADRAVPALLTFFFSVFLLSVVMAFAPLRVVVGQQPREAGRGLLRFLPDFFGSRQIVGYGVIEGEDPQLGFKGFGVLRLAFPHGLNLYSQFGD